MKIITLSLCLSLFVSNLSAIELEISPQPHSISILTNVRNVISYAIENPVKTLGLISLLSIVTTKAETKECKRFVDSFVMGIEGPPNVYETQTNMTLIDLNNLTYPHYILQNCSFITPCPSLGASGPLACCKIDWIPTPYENLACFEDLIWQCEDILHGEVGCTIYQELPQNTNCTGVWGTNSPPKR